MQLYVVIVAGGSGKRMGAEIPKQFLELAGRPVLMHTIERFKSFNDSIEIITVLPENQLRHWCELQEKYSFKILQTLVTTDFIPLGTVLSLYPFLHLWLYTTG
jgi:2-C-methyl-D-erythritol 4-phosphate cytidylyltransferase